MTDSAFTLTLTEAEREALVNALEYTIREEYGADADLLAMPTALRKVHALVPVPSLPTTDERLASIQEITTAIERWKGKYILETCQCAECWRGRAAVKVLENARAALLRCVPVPKLRAPRNYVQLGIEDGKLGQVPYASSIPKPPSLDPSLPSPFAEAMVHIRRRAGLPRFTVRRVPIGTRTPFGLAWVIRDREYPFFIGRARTHAEAIQRIDERARRY